MVSLNQSFDATKVDPSQTRAQMPIGRHPVIIESTELKENNNKDGGYIEFTLRIIDGPAKGVEGAYRLNIYHSNAKTVEIAYKQLSALCHVTGVYVLNDTDQLRNIPFLVDVALQTSEEGKAKGYTQITKVFDRNGNEPGKPANAGGPAQPQPAQGPAGPGQASWGQPQTPAQPAPPAQQQAAPQPSWQQPAGGPPAAAGQQWNGAAPPAAAGPGGQQWNQAGNGGGAPAPGAQPNWQR